MARQIGTLPLQGNIEADINAPLDARLLVNTKAELTVAANYPSAYIGMMVYVKDEGKFYVLKNSDTTQDSSWEEFTAGDSGKAFVAEYNVTTAQEILAYIDASNEPYAPVMLKRGSELYTALLVLKQADNKVYVRVIGTVSGKYYFFNYTITDAVWSLSTVEIGGGGGTMGYDYNTNIEVGGIEKGSAISKDESISDFLKRMLVTTYCPTYVAPSATLTYAGNTLMKVGSAINPMTGTVAFNPGAIMLEGTKQANRAGNATSFTLKTTGANTDFDETNTTGNFAVTEMKRSSKGNIVFTATVNHEAGPQPKDSDGNDYESPLAAGTVTTSKTIEFILPFYWGASNSPDVLDLTGFTEDLTKKGNKSYKYTTTNQYIAFAYDASYGGLTSILDQNGFETLTSYKKSTITFEGQNYFVYTMKTPSTDTNATTTFKF